jgi:hypothetical protein
VGKTVVIAAEPPAPCELCGEVEELRPYGPNGARVCFDCAMKDREGTKKRMNKILYGEDDA